MKKSWQGGRSSRALSKFDEGSLTQGINPPQVREISMDMMTGAGNYDTGLNGLRWQTSALLALQEAAEAYLVHLFEDASVAFIRFLHPVLIVNSSATCVLFTPKG